ncbi:MAG: M20/M25/M40 family metallo-hydrolase [Balneolales bacterium]
MRIIPRGFFIILCTLVFGALNSCTLETENQQNYNPQQLDPVIEQILSEISAKHINDNINRLASFHTRHTLSETESNEVGIGAARRWIKAEMEKYSQKSGGRLQVEFDSYIQEPTGALPEEVEIVNIVATLPGTQPESKERVYVVSGHYDSRATDLMDAEIYAPGANDDASGTASVMELARVMSHYEFDATLVFMAVAGEEQGLFGAQHFAQSARANNINIAGMITNDIIGSSTAEDGSVHDKTIRLFAEGIPPEREVSDEAMAYLRTGGENDMPPRQLARNIKEVAENYLPDLDINIIYRRDRYLRGGDHIAFLEEGYPAVRFSEPNENFRHQHQDVREEDGVQYGDLPEYVDYDYVAQATKVNASALANLAKAPATPGQPGMNTSSLDNSTTLRWQPNTEPTLDGYEIVWRETSSPVWQHSKFVGDTNSYTIEGYSKDNYLFGIRSVGKGGHISPAAYPLPYR